MKLTISGSSLTIMILRPGMIVISIWSDVHLQEQLNCYISTCTRGMIVKQLLLRVCWLYKEQTTSFNAFWWIQTSLLSQRNYYLVMLVILWLWTQKQFLSVNDCSTIWQMSNFSFSMTTTTFRRVWTTMVERCKILFFDQNQIVARYISKIKQICDFDNDK